MGEFVSVVVWILIRVVVIIIVVVVSLFHFSICSSQIDVFFRVS